MSADNFVELIRKEDGWYWAMGSASCTYPAGRLPDAAFDHGPFDTAAHAEQNAWDECHIIEYGVTEASATQRLAYLAGPMRGLPEYNYPAFNQAADELRQMGFAVFNPAEQAHPDDPELVEDLSYWMRRDIPELARCDDIILLPGWQNSDGAVRELAAADWFGLRIYTYNNAGELTRHNADDLCEPTLRPKLLELKGLFDAEPEENILQEADRLAGGDRNVAYGHPFEDFSRTAGMISSLFGDKLKPGEQFEPEDIGLIMVCVKCSRQRNAPKRDNLTDGAGYFRTIEMCGEYRSQFKSE